MSSSHGSSKSSLELKPTSTEITLFFLAAAFGWMGSSSDSGTRFKVLVLSFFPASGDARTQALNFIDWVQVSADYWDNKFWLAVVALYFLSRVSAVIGSFKEFAVGFAVALEEKMEARKKAKTEAGGKAKISEHPTDH